MRAVWVIPVIVSILVLVLLISANNIEANTQTFQFEIPSTSAFTIVSDAPETQRSSFADFGIVPTNTNSIDSSKFANINLPFIENNGQIDENVKFYANTFAGTVYVTNSEIVYFDFDDSENKESSITIKEKFIGTSNLNPKSLTKNNSVVNYFVGEKENWRSNVPTHKSITLGEVWPSVDVELNAYGNNIEKIFTIHPGGSVEDIQLGFEGIDGLSVESNGKLALETEFGSIFMTKPVAHQVINDNIREVFVSYSIDGKTYGFEVKNYDPNYELIIDPLLASTFLGGNEVFRESGVSISIDSSGNVFVFGQTSASNFPTSTGAFDQTFNSGGDTSDFFISKFDNDLTTLLASTFIGGSSREFPGSFSLQ